MSAKQFQRIIISSLFACAFTALHSLLNQQHLTEKRTAFGLHWARQITTQVEGLHLFAQEKNEANPLGWAVKMLTLGTEDRLMEVHTFTDRNSAPPLEKYQLDPEAGVFRYSKVLSPENGSGVRIQIHLGYQGFLGAQSLGMNDLLLVACFLIGFILFYSIWHRINSRKPKPQDIPPEEPTNSHFEETHQQFLLFVSEWSTEAKTTLLQLGHSVKDLTQEAHTLATASLESRKFIEILLGSSALNAQEHAELAKQTHESNTKIYQATQDVNKYINETKRILIQESKLLANLKEQAQSQASEMPQSLRGEL